MWSRVPRISRAHGGANQAREGSAFDEGVPVGAGGETINAVVTRLRAPFELDPTPLGELDRVAQQVVEHLQPATKTTIRDGAVIGVLGGVGPAWLPRAVGGSPYGGYDAMGTISGPWDRVEEMRLTP